MRRAIWPLLGLCLVLGLTQTSCERSASPEKPAATAVIGGPFHLVDQDGRPFTDKDLKGKPTAIFFGFTFCPEVCPTTLADMTRWLAALGPDGDRVNVVFVSIDPTRDTPSVLKHYLGSFDPRIRGLTGTEAEIARTAREYRIYYKKVPLPGGGYTMDHTAGVFLFDRNGQFAGAIGYGGDPNRGVGPLRQLLGR